METQFLNADSVKQNYSFALHVNIYFTFGCENVISWVCQPIQS